MALAIEMKNIRKTFPGVVANDNIDLIVPAGEIHCLLGENGAGKTTLMKILFGLYQPDRGSIAINGQQVKVNNPKDALQLGLGMVHQHFMLVNRLSVLENVILGNEPGGFSLELKKSAEIVGGLAERYGFKLDLQEKIENLSVGVKQRVEILKTLYRGAEIIILDEPTAVLTPLEVTELFKILGELKRQGKTIIFITHKLNETMEVADRITVLRDGKTVVTLLKEQTTPKELARYMVGRDVLFNLEKQVQPAGETVLAVHNVKLLKKATKPASFELRGGEILGFAGVEGNGQLELEEILMGLRKVESGQVYLQGQDITTLSTRQRKKCGMGYIPSDRHRRAMLKNFSLRENLLLGYHFHLPFARRGVIQRKELLAHSQKMIDKFNIRTPNAEQKMKFLSGGNQQKVIFSREVSQDPALVIAAQPTRGLDIGAIEYVHNLLLDLRAQGKAVLLISADLTEVLKLSDRIAVLYEGEIKALKEAHDYADEEIGLLMAGEERGSE